jgi:hypothetical protein
MKAGKADRTFDDAKDRFDQVGAAPPSLRSWPRLSRPSMSLLLPIKGVAARDKPGHERNIKVLQPRHWM